MMKNTQQIEDDIDEIVVYLLDNIDNTDEQTAQELDVPKDVIADLRETLESLYGWEW